MEKLYFSGIIITDKNDIILECNSNMKNCPKMDPIIGLKFEIVKLNLLIHSMFYYDCRNQNIYIINIKKESDSFLEYVVENTYDEIFVTDGRGVAVFCNRVFEDHYGIKKEDILGKDVQVLQEKGLVDKILVHKVIEDKKTITTKQKTSEGKVILNTLKPILDDNGEVMYVIENCRDISKTTQLEQVLKLKDKKIKTYESKLKYYNTLDTKKVLEFKSPVMSQINDTVKRLSKRDVNILLLGDSGTGKTYLANKIHKMSMRSDGPFVTINCTTIPENLMESELFGYEKGSFTGASMKGKEGLVEQADKGTLFLDEIGEVPLAMQSKLLQLIQEKTYVPIGSIYPKSIDVKIISATNKNLLDLVDKGKFRKDLYYRLALGVIHLPSLKERPEDVNKLIDHYLSVFNKKYELRVKISDEAKYILLNYSWPGNIRELEHLLEFLVVNTSEEDTTIQKNNLPSNIINEVMHIENFTKVNTEGLVKKGENNDKGYTLKKLMDSYENKIIRSAYLMHPSSYKVARFLNISQSKAHRLISKYCNDI